MRKGQIVKIYQKPSTEEDFEGYARLIKKLNNITDFEVWEVKFLNDGFTVTRLLNKQRRII